MHHSGLILCGSAWARAFRHRDLHHVHAFSNQFAVVAKFFSVGRRVSDSWLERVRRYITPGAYHRIQRLRATRPNGRRVLSCSRFDRQHRRTSWCVSVETRTGAKFSWSSSSRRRWNDFLCKNDSPKPAISLGRSKKAVGDAPKSLEIAKCRFRCFGLQPRSVFWPSRWERLARTA